VLDVGACTGFFALQIAQQHPEADILGIEGSVGIGNGEAGRLGDSNQILSTQAVRTNLKWIQSTKLQNCFVAPEVWDYHRICELASSGKPVCDVMLTLSVIHHIDSMSLDSYRQRNLSRVMGVIGLMGKLLLLSQRHFVELPARNYLEAAYNEYGSARGILDAAAKASGRSWRFTGPIYSSEWFGIREVWIMECQDDIGEVDVQECPFPLIYRGDEAELEVTRVEEQDDIGRDQDALSNLMDYDVLSVCARYRLDPNKISDPLAKLDRLVDERHSRFGLTLDPGYLTLGCQDHAVVDERIGYALSTAPSDLLIAHLGLREAVTEAKQLLHDHNLRGESQKLQNASRQQQQQHNETASGSRNHL
jgi:hypothetical protein